MRPPCTICDEPANRDCEVGTLCPWCCRDDRKAAGELDACVDCDQLLWEAAMCERDDADRDAA